MITRSCGIKILAVCSIVLSQSTRVTDRQTDGQNYDSQHRVSIAASRGKNCIILYIASAVLSQYTRITDRQTTDDDRHLMGIAEPAMQLQCTVKNKNERQTRKLS